MTDFCADKIIIDNLQNCLKQLTFSLIHITGNNFADINKILSVNVSIEIKQN